MLLKWVINVGWYLEMDVFSILKSFDGNLLGFYNFKGHSDKHCNLSHCKIDQVLSCIDSFILELSLLALKATIISDSLSKALFCNFIILANFGHTADPRVSNYYQETFINNTSFNTLLHHNYNIVYYFCNIKILFSLH